MEPIVNNVPQSFLSIDDISVNLFQPTITEGEDGKKVISIDGVLKATIQIPVESIKRKLLLIVVVDKSRSIQSAWFQIQSTLLNLFAMVSNVEQEVILEILFFNNVCYRLIYNKDNYRELILNEKPGNKTCFAAAFNSIQDVITRYYKLNSALKSERDHDPLTDTAIVLLTDGSHTTTRDHKKAFKELGQAIDKVKKSSVVVSTMGFTSNSRFNDLDGIRRILGTTPGIYQYSDPADGVFALQEKLTFILKYVLTSSNSYSLNIKLSTTHATNEGLSIVQGSDLTFNNNSSESIKSSNKFGYQLSLDSFGIGEINFGLSSNGYDISDIKIEMDINNDPKLRSVLLIKPTIKNDQSQESTFYSLLIGLDSKLNVLLGELEKFNATNQPTDQQKEIFLKQILSYQKSCLEIDNLVLFKLKSSSRSEIVQLKQQCLTMSSQLLDLVNSWNRSAWSTTSNARIADITYRYMFKNTGRQRRINLKVARNATNIKSEAVKFNELVVDLESLESLEDEQQAAQLEASKQLFTDVLSLSDWVEALEEKDIMGFGLSVQRPEVVIDDPTQIRIQEISTTFICKSSIEDAIALSLEVHGQEKTTGGFQVGYDKQSVAVRGRGREPINSWLPLYLNAEHWKPIKYQLKNIIAYFVTLDPMAFSYDQINALFLVLGSMISKDDIGERELLLAIQYIRTIREVVLHFNFIPRMLQQLDSILNNPIYLISAQPKNLFVLVSYLLVLTEEELEPIFKNGKSDHFKFWQNVLETSIRRSSYTFFDKMEQIKIDSFLSNILFGSNNEEKVEVVSGEGECSSSTTTAPPTQDELFNLLLNYKYEKISFEQQDYMELLNIKKKTFTEQDVNDSINGIKETNASMVESMIKISNLLENRGYPGVSPLLNSLRFVKTWKSIYCGGQELQVFEKIDYKFGIPPNEFIEIMKNGTRVQPQLNNNGIGRFIATINECYGNEASSVKSSSSSTLLYHLRAMIVQAVSYRINRHATCAVVEKKLHTEVYTDYSKCIENITKDVIGRAQDAIKAMQVALLFSANTNTALKSSNMHDFIGTIPHYGHRYFMDFFHSLISIDQVPFGEQKLIILLSNVFVTSDDYGTISTQAIKPHGWVFGKRSTSTLTKRLGRERAHNILIQVFFYRYLNEKHSFKITELDDDLI